MVREMRRWNAVVASICALDPAPDLVLATGDLTEAGTPASYRDLRGILDALPMPVHFAMGNHDDRANFRAVFPQAKFDNNGFVQFTCQDPVLLLDHKLLRCKHDQLYPTCLFIPTQLTRPSLRYPPMVMSQFV